MKITLTEQYFSKANFNQYIITDGMTTETELEVSSMIGNMALVSAKELAKHAKPAHAHLADDIIPGRPASDYPFREGEYKET